MATQNVQAAGQVEEVARLLDAVVTVSTSRIPVLLLGPRGSGINLLAKCIHVCSPREARAFVVMRCGLGSPASTEAQLLGSRPVRTSHRSDERPDGCLQKANGGTLFIEQIQNASAQTQTELLRVVTEGEYVDAGGITHRIDVRLVVSGWHDLKERVEQGRFRADLYERLSRVVLQLRKGSSDQEYILHVVQLLCGHAHARESDSNLDTLRGLAWSSEIQSSYAALQNSGKNGAGHVSPDDVLLESLRRVGQRNSQKLAQQNVQAASAAVERCLETYEAFGGQLYEKLLSQLQRTLIEKAMIQCNGTISRTATTLGISIALLQLKLRELGLSD
jgi:DNA-binding NtrC family response regulator